MHRDFSVLLRYLPDLLTGLTVTVSIVLASLVFGVLIGLIACYGKLQGKGPAFWFSAAYIDIFRTLPEMVTIFWIYSCLPLIFDVRFSSVTCGVLALSLVSGAYMAEIFRTGVSAIPKGELEAAWALGLPVRFIWSS